MSTADVIMDKKGCILNSSNRHLRNLMENIATFYKNCKLPDVKFIVKNEEFSCHKIVLAAASPYFETMFSTDLYNSEQTTIEMHDIDVDIFKIIITYIYTGTCSFSERNVQDILRVSDMLQVTDLITDCYQFFRLRFNMKNWVIYYQIADSFSHIKEFALLKFECKKLIEENFVEVSYQKNFLDLSFSLIENFFKSEGLKISDEMDVLNAAIAWISKYPEERTEYIDVLMKHVRLPIILKSKKREILNKCKNSFIRAQLKRIFFENEIEKFNFDKENISEDCSTECDNSLIQNKKLNKDMIIRSSARMGCSSPIYFLKCLNGSSKYKFSLRKYDPNRKFVETLIKFEDNPTHIIQLDGLFYYFSRVRSEDIFFYKLDPFTKQISRGKKILRNYFISVALNGYLYVMGGEYMNEDQYTVERYNPNADSWSLVDFIPYSFGNSEACAYKGKIYIIGENNDLFSYDPLSKTLEPLPSLPSKRRSFGVAVLHDFIYVVGGIKSNDYHVVPTVERYSIKEGIWSEVSSLNVARSKPALIVVKNELWAIAGFIDYEYTNCCCRRRECIIETYHPELNKWFMNYKPIMCCGNTKVVSHYTKY